VAPIKVSPAATQAPAALPEANRDGEADAEAAGGALADRLGLRPRLKLAPTSRDEALSAVFEAPVSAPQTDADDEEEPGETWTWKDLLASLNGGGEPAAQVSELAVALRKMGVDPEALLPRPRLEQIAQALQSGDADGARQMVKRLAGASARRIVRRLFTDATLKAQAEAFVQAYQPQVDQAVAAGGLVEVLTAEAGRVFLLLDQALADRPAPERA